MLHARMTREADGRQPGKQRELESIWDVEGPKADRTLEREIASSRGGNTRGVRRGKLRHGQPRVRRDNLAGDLTCFDDERVLSLSSAS